MAIDFNKFINPTVSGKKTTIDLSKFITASPITANIAPDSASLALGFGDGKEQIRTKKYVQDLTNPYASIPIEQADPLTQYRSLTLDDIKKMKGSELVDLRIRAGLDKGTEKKWYSSFMAGVGDLMTTIGSVGKMVDQKEGKISQMGETLQEAGKITQSKYTDYDALEKLGEFDWGDLKDPAFWTNKGVRALPFTMSLIPLAMVGGSLGVGVASTMGLGALGTAITGAVGATALSRPAEGFMEAGGAYDEALAKGMSREKAVEVANKVFIENLKQMSALDVIQMIPFIKNMKGFQIGNVATNRIINILGTGTGIVSEGFEEVLQNKIVSEALGEKFNLLDSETKESFVLGVAMGGVFQGSGGIVNLTQKAINDSVSGKLSPDLKKAYDQEYNNFIKEGKTQSDSANLALNEVAKLNQKQVQEAIKETINEKATELKKAGIEEVANKTDSNVQSGLPARSLAAPFSPEGKISLDKFLVNKDALLSEAMGIDKTTKIKEDISKPVDDISTSIQKAKPQVEKVKPKEEVLKIEEPVIKKGAETGISKHFEKIRKEFGFDARRKGIVFEKITTKDQVKRAYNYISRFPKQAMQIAYGLREAPLGINAQAIRQSLYVSLKESGKKAQADEIARLTSREFTKTAQTLNLAKVDLGVKNETAIMQSITNERMEALGEKLGKVKPEEIKEAVQKQIRTKTEKATRDVLQTQSKTKESMFKDLDRLVDKIIC